MIDRSASMGAAGEVTRRLRKPSKQAGELLKDLPPGTAAHLAYFDADGVEPRPEARIDAALEPRPSGTDYGKALGWARDIVVGSRRREPRGVSLDRPSALRACARRLEPPFPARHRGST